jgi:hypothetical protein
MTESKTEKLRNLAIMARAELANFGAGKALLDTMDKGQLLAHIENFLELQVLYQLRSISEDTDSGGALFLGIQHSLSDQACFVRGLFSVDKEHSEKALKKLRENGFQVKYEREEIGIDEPYAYLIVKLSLPEIKSVKSVSAPADSTPPRLEDRLE